MFTKLKDESLLNDMLFKESLTNPNNRDFLIRLISLITDFKEDYLKKQDLKVSYETTLNKTKLSDKSLRSDIIIKFDHYTINLESYTTFGNIALVKSLSYVMRIFSTQLDKGKNYDVLESVIQINFLENNSTNIGDKLINTYALANVEYPHNILSDKFIIKFINVDKASKRSYTKEEEKLLNILKFISAKNYEERKEVAKGDELLMDFNEWLNKYMYNEETLEFYHNWDLAIAKDAGFSEGKTAGFSEGKTAGEKSSKIEIAKKMLQKEIPIKDIASITNLTIEGEKSSKIEIAKNLLKLDVPTKDICMATGLTKKEVDSLKD